MQYAVTRDGRPVGVTDLGFTRFDNHVRAGWFFPNSLSPAAAEAFDWHGQLNFELRRPDGSIVPTELIGIQDTHRLVSALSPHSASKIQRPLSSTVQVCGDVRKYSLMYGTSIIIGRIAHVPYIRRH